MTQIKSIIIFAGLSGSGVSAAVRYCTQKNIPKIDMTAIIQTCLRHDDNLPDQAYQQQFRDEHRVMLVKKVIEQVEHIAQSGQKHVCIDNITDWNELKSLRQYFPGRVHIIGLLTPHHIRYQRLEQRTHHSYNHQEAYLHDIYQIEHQQKAGAIAIADHFIINTGSEEKLHQKINSVLAELSIIG